MNIWSLVDIALLLLALWSTYFCLSHTFREWTGSKRRAILALVAAAIPGLVTAY